MRNQALILTVWTLLSLESLSAEEPPQVLPSRKVGTVYGKAITASDIGLTAPIDPAVQFDARDKAKWELMGRIVTAFGRPVVDRFVKRQKIEATAEEIEKFKKNFRQANERNVREWKARLAELKKELALTTLTEEARAKLEKEEAMYEQLIAGNREPGAGEAPDVLARTFIVAWKIERQLHREYGGRVIFQQAGPEALDARRRLFEKAEEQGDITFDDTGVRHMFYYYANMKHTVIDEKSLERPWFLDDEMRSVLTKRRIDVVRKNGGFRITLPAYLLNFKYSRQDPMTAAISIHRPCQYADMLRQYRLIVDNQDVGLIRRGETIVLPVAPGEHAIEARIDWCSSRPQTIQVSPHQTAELVVGSNVAGWRLLAALIYIVLWTRDYLFVKLA